MSESFNELPFNNKPNNQRFNNNNKSTYASFFQSFMASGFVRFILVLIISYMLVSIFGSFALSNHKSLRDHYSTFVMLLLLGAAVYHLGNLQNLFVSNYIYPLILFTPIFVTALSSFFYFTKDGDALNLFTLFMLSIIISVTLYTIYHITSISNEKISHYIIAFVTILWFLLGLSFGQFKMNNYILFALVALHARDSSQQALGLGGIYLGLMVRSLAVSKSLSVFKDSNPPNNTCEDMSNKTQNLL